MSLESDEKPCNFDNYSIREKINFEQFEFQSSCPSHEIAFKYLVGRVPSLQS